MLVPDGKGGEKYKYVWNDPIAFQDESFLYSAAFRRYSWCNKDRTYDKKKEGDGIRICLVHTIFSHLDPQPTKDDGSPEALAAWSSTWTGKHHEFKGNCDGDDIERYFKTRTFKYLGKGGVAILDNAGTHKVHMEDIKDRSAAELETYIEDRIKFSKKDKKEGRYKYLLYEEYWALRAEKMPLKHDAKVYLKFIRENHLQDTVLREMATAREITLNYLPGYYPECNPIERYWALLKRKYYDSNPSLSWRARLDVAVSQIPEDYIDKCISKSLKWVWDKLAQLKEEDPEPGVQDILDAQPDSDDSEGEGLTYNTFWAYSLS